MLIRFASRLARSVWDRDDLVQDVCLRILLSRPSPKGIRDIDAFVGRMLRNHYLNSLRARRRRGPELVRDMMALPAPYRDVGQPSGVAADRVLDVVVKGLAPRDVLVIEEWCRNPVVRAVARSLSLDVRQVKRSLTKSALAVRSALEARHDSCPPSVSIAGETAEQEQPQLAHLKSFQEPH